MTQQDQTIPLVSVGVPTYNRIATLRRTVASVLAQDYPNVEVVISDDASTDGTQEWCEELSRRDNRVRYVRQSANIGLTANYVEVFRQSRGEYYLALADDDWLDRSYVSQCLQTLLGQPDLALVCGKPRMFRGHEYQYDGRHDNALQRSGAQRIIHYLRWVVEDAELHGVMRRETIESVPPMPNILAGDWLFIASILFNGKARTLESVAINKSLGGVSSSWTRQIEVYGLSRYQARLRGLPYFIIIWSAFKDIAWESPVYRRCGRVGRFVLACRACAALFVKFAILNGGYVRSTLKGVWQRYFTRMARR